MPLVKVRHKPTIGNPILARLGPALAEAVASALTCSDEGGHLTEEEIEVFFDPMSQHDTTSLDLMIDVEAMRFPGRKNGGPDEPNFSQRVSSLGGAVRKLVPGHLGFGLWVKLLDARWFESSRLCEHSLQSQYESSPGI